MPPLSFNMRGCNVDVKVHGATIDAAAEPVKVSSLSAAFICCRRFLGIHLVRHSISNILVRRGSILALLNQPHHHD